MQNEPMQNAQGTRKLGRTVAAMLVHGGGLIANLVLARMLTPAVWGLFIAIVSANQTLYRLTNIGGGQQERLSETSLDTDGLTQADLAGAALLATGVLASCALALSIVLARPIADFFGAPELQTWMFAAGIGAAAQFASGYGSAALSGSGNFLGVTLVSTVASAIYLLLLGAAMTVGFHELWTAVAAFLIVQLGSALWSVARGLRLQKRLGMTPSFAHGRPARLQVMRFGLTRYLTPLLPALALFVLMGELSREAGVGALAGFCVALTLAQLVLLSAGAVSRAFTGASEDGVRPSEFGSHLKLVTASAIVTMLAVAALAPDATPILFGATYAPAVDSVFIALMAAGIQAVKQAMLAGIVSKRRAPLALLDSIVSAAAVLPLGFRLIPDYGLGGLLIAQGLSEAASAALLLAIVVWRFWRETPLRDAAAAGAALAFALAATAAGHWTAESDIHLSVFTLFLEAALFIGAYGLIGRSERERIILSLRDLLPFARAAPGRSK